MQTQVKVPEDLRARTRLAAMDADHNVSYKAVDAAVQLIYDEVVEPLEREKEWNAKEFPRYQMVIDGATHWLPIQRAGVAYDNGWQRVKIGDRVIERDGTERAIANDERRKIVKIADEHSASK